VAGGALITETAPFVGIADGGLGGVAGPIGWDTVQPVLQVWLHEAYGEEALLRESLNTTRKWLATLEAAPAKAVEGGLGDWMAIEQPRLAMSGRGFELMNYRALASIAASLGEARLSHEYSAKAAAAAASFNLRFLKANGLYAESASDAPSQCGQAMFLAFGLPPNTTVRSAALGQLFQAVKTPQRPASGPQPEASSFIATGMFGVKWFLLSLAEGGHNELAYSIVTQPKYPGYGYMLQQQATTLWESWFYSDGVFSHNHPAFSSYIVWMLRSLAGLALHSPGRVSIHPSPPPQLHEAGWVNASLATPHGRLGAAWQWRENHFTLHAMVPPGATAELSLPSNRPRLAAMDALAARIVGEPGNAAARFSGGRLFLKPLGGGTYSFTSVLLAPKSTQNWDAVLV